MNENQIFGIEQQYFDSAMKVVQGLYGLERTGWVRRGVNNPETDGQHIDSLITMAKKFCEIRKDLDQKKLVRMLQIHDWPEHLNGDPVVAAKDPKEKERERAKKYIEEEAALRKICSEVGPEGEVIFKLWEEFEAKQTPEAKVAKQLDKLQAMYKAWEYEQAGNGKVSAMDFINSDRDVITDPILVQWLQDLENEVNAGK